MLLKAGRDLDTADDADAGAVAGLVDDGLFRARTAVETLVTPDVRDADLRPSAAAHHNRAATYAVFGIGLVGIAAFIVVGLRAARGLATVSPPGTHSTSPRSRLAWRARMKSRSESRLR